MYRRVFILLLIIWAKVEATNTTTTGSSWTVILKVFENCADNNDSLTCLQKKVLNFANRIAQAKNLEIFDGLKFVKVEKMERSTSDKEPNTSVKSLSVQIWDKIISFFKTHIVEVNIPKFYEFDLDEARKKKGGYGGLMLMAGALKGAMIYIGMHAIAALAGKALLVAKVALTIASVIALKKLLEGNHEKTSYEIIKHPQHSYVQTHSSSHEYGGGGHGGGYEGHYRKRSIARNRMNAKEKFGIPVAFGEPVSGAPLEFELPKNDPGKKFLADSTDPINYQWTNNGGLHQKADKIYLYKEIGNKNEEESTEPNLFDFNSVGKNLQTESGEEVWNKEFSPLNPRRLLLTKFV